MTPLGERCSRLTSGRSSQRGSFFNKNECLYAAPDLVWEGSGAATLSAVFGEQAGDFASLLPLPSWTGPRGEWSSCQSPVWGRGEAGPGMSGAAAVPHAFPRLGLSRSREGMESRWVEVAAGWMPVLAPFPERFLAMNAWSYPKISNVVLIWILFFPHEVKC